MDRRLLSIGLLVLLAAGWVAWQIYAGWGLRCASGKAHSIGESADGHSGRAPRDREDRAGQPKRAGSRIRTDDRLITNQVLYQLSYTGNLNFNKSSVTLLRQGAGGESAAPELWM